MLRQWLDSDYHPNPEALKQASDKVDWERCVPFVMLHLGLLALFWVKWSWIAVAAALFFYVVRMFSITAFYHRYFSHRSFKTSRFMQFVFAVWANTAMQRGALWWASTHRHHHRHSDHHEDVHSPKISGFWWSHIGWITSKKNFPTNYQEVKDFAKYPELVFLNRFDQLVPIMYAGLMYGLGWWLETTYPNLGVEAAQFFVWTVFVSTVVLLHSTLLINSLAHISGRQRYETQDDSRNNLWLALLTLGEGWHNNHHRYPHSAKQGFFWHEIDMTYYGLKVMSWLGLIKDLRPVPKKILTEPS